MFETRAEIRRAAREKALAKAWQEGFEEGFEIGLRQGVKERLISKLRERGIELPKDVEEDIFGPDPRDSLLVRLKTGISALYR